MKEHPQSLLSRVQYIASLRIYSRNFPITASSLSARAFSLTYKFFPLSSMISIVPELHEDVGSDQHKILLFWLSLVRFLTLTLLAQA